jgi:hypothetical protein
MLLRICLILAIVTGLGVIGVSQFMLKPQIEEIIKTRDDNKAGWDRTSAELSKTKKTLKDTSEKLAKTETTLEETKGQLVATTGRFEAEQKRANGLQQTLDKTKADLKVASDELAAWAGLGLKVEQVRGVIDDAKNLKIANEGLQQEGKVLASKLQTAERKIKDLTSDKETDPPVPQHVRGKVLVVDPKWDFLVLDVGAKNELLERSVLLVSRNGELVAKIRVTNVQDQRSIANIMPGWKIKDVLEGDVVLPY